MLWLTVVVARDKKRQATYVESLTRNNVETPNEAWVIFIDVKLEFLSLFFLNECWILGLCWRSLK